MPKTDTCAICKETEFRGDHGKVTVQPCKHKFGENCLKTSLTFRPLCPLCNVFVTSYINKSGKNKYNIQNKVRNWIRFNCLGVVQVSLIIIVLFLCTILNNNANKDYPSIKVIDGKLKMHGNNEYGQLGQGDTDVYFFPKYVPNLENITKASSSGKHTGVIINKKLYMFGKNTHGQLGLGDHQNRAVPTIVPGLDNVTEVICISDYTAVINSGALYMFGASYNGLGVGDYGVRNSPTLIAELNNVKKILCTDAYTVVLQGDYVYTFGLIDNRYLLLSPVKIAYNDAYDISEVNTVYRNIHSHHIYIHFLNQEKSVCIYSQIRLNGWKTDYYQVFPTNNWQNYIYIEPIKLPQMENLIKSYCENNKLIYIPLSETSIERVYNLLIKNKFQEPETDIEMLYFGKYYEVKRDLNNTKKYYLMAVDNGNTDAMHYLGWYYLYLEKDYDKMEKYWLMAIEGGNNRTLYDLGRYHHYTTKDYDKMLTYYFMAIENKNTMAMIDLGTYYKEQEDYNNMEKYYIMSIEAGDNNVRFTLAKYYQEHDDYNSLLELFIKTKQYQEFSDTLEYMYKSNKPYNEKTIQHIIDNVSYLTTDSTELLIKILFQFLKPKS